MDFRKLESTVMVPKRLTACFSSGRGANVLNRKMKRCHIRTLRKDRMGQMTLLVRTRYEKRASIKRLETSTAQLILRRKLSWGRAQEAPGSGSVSTGADRVSLCHCAPVSLSRKRTPILYLQWKRKDEHVTKTHAYNESSAPGAVFRLWSAQLCLLRLV